MLKTVIIEKELQGNASTDLVKRRETIKTGLSFYAESITTFSIIPSGQEDSTVYCLMVNSKENNEKLRTAFTVTVDAKHGTTTGVSAQDRAKTVLALASRDSTTSDFNRPDHIFPLKYREGGVLKRAGHTEASVDLAILAGLDPAAVLCEFVDDDVSKIDLCM